MGETVLMVVGCIVLIGFVVGGLLYKPFAIKMIVNYGYDPDESVLGFLLGAAGLVCVVIALTKQAYTLLLGTLVCMALCALLHMKKVGVVNAILLAVLQTLSFLLTALVWLVKFASSMISGGATGDRSEEKRAIQNARKEEAFAAYQAKVAAAERGRDASLTDAGMDPADAQIAAAQQEYQQTVSDIEHTPKV